MPTAPHRLALALALALTALLLTPLADARPLIYRGVLTDADGAPVTTRVELGFSLLPAADAAHEAGGVELVVAVTPDDRGVFEAPIDADAFGPTALAEEQWLGIRVRLAPEAPWEAFPPPHPALGAVPYAVVCDDVHGVINPASVNVGGREVISAEGRWVGDLELDDAQVARLAEHPALVAAIAAQLAATHGEALRGQPGESPTPEAVATALAAEVDTPELREAVAERVGLREVHWPDADITVCGEGCEDGACGRACDFDDINEALDALNGYVFRQPESEVVWRRPYCWVALRLGGRFGLDEPVVIRHPQGQNLCIVGNLSANGPATLEFTPDAVTYPNAGVLVDGGGALGALSDVHLVAPDEPDPEGQGRGIGVRVIGRSDLLVGNNVAIRGFHTGVRIEFDSHLRNEVIGDGAPTSISGGTTGIYIASGAHAHMPGVVVHDQAQYCAYALQGASLWIEGASMRGCQQQAVRANDSYVSADRATVYDSGFGFVGANGARLLAVGSSAACNRQHDYAASSGAMLIVTEADYGEGGFSHPVNEVIPTAIIQSDAGEPIDPAICGD